MATTRLRDRYLPPDIFAVVMATGIVSIAAADHDYSAISDALRTIATVIFVALTLALGWCVATRWGEMVAEFRDPDAALRMFTFVAGASVLGVVWRPYPWVVWLLGALATVAWAVLMPLAIRDVRSRPRDVLRDHAHGSWLLVSVATSGLATTAADLAIIARSPELAWLAGLLWLVAVVLYAVVTYLIAWRAIIAPFRPSAFTPDSWILMGALAIATLAGAHLVEAARDVTGQQWLAALAVPATVIVWAAASLWIPVLTYGELWRVDQQPGSLRFSGVWWSAVFPLGMYASATAGTAMQLAWSKLSTISLVMFWVAFLVWAMVAVGLIRQAVDHVRAAQRR